MRDEFQVRYMQSPALGHFVQLAIPDSQRIIDRERLNSFLAGRLDPANLIFNHSWLPEKAKPGDSWRTPGFCGRTCPCFPEDALYVCFCTLSTFRREYLELKYLLTSFVKENTVTPSTT